MFALVFYCYCYLYLIRLLGGLGVRISRLVCCLLIWIDASIRCGFIMHSYFNVLLYASVLVFALVCVAVLFTCDWLLIMTYFACFLVVSCE